MVIFAWVKSEALCKFEVEFVSFLFFFPFQFMFYTLKLDAFKNDGLFLLFSGERPDFESILYWLFLLNLPARRRTL